MSTTAEPPAIDMDKLMAFVFKAVDEVGATLNSALVVMGDKLGLYRALAGAGGLTPGELAERAGVAERYVREWLNAQAAGGYVEYDPATGRYTLPPEQTVALTDEDSPAYLPGFFQIAVGSVLDPPRITEVSRSGAGVGWHEHNHDVFDGCERFFRPGYNATSSARGSPRSTASSRSSSAAPWWPTSAARAPRLLRPRHRAGGLSTTMELALARRPFLYFPLADHCEQVRHVAHRLDRHGAGRRMEYATTTPESLADAALATLGADTSVIRLPEPGAAERAASLIAELL